MPTFDIDSRFINENIARVARLNFLLIISIVSQLLAIHITNNELCTHAYAD